MGNVSGRKGASSDDDIEANGDDNLERSSSFSDTTRRVCSEGALAPRDLPLASPGSLLSPRMFAPQMPVPPLQKSAGAHAHPVFNQILMNEQEDTDVPPEKEIPVLLVWTLGGNNVSVEGSWDSWKTRKILQKSGKDFSILLSLPSGLHRYKFIVDGKLLHVPDLPCEVDGQGQTVNLLDVNDYVPENVECMAEFEPPPSPDSTYGVLYPEDKELAKEPPPLPPQLHHGIPGVHHAEEDCLKPQHVVLDHLFIEKGWGSQPLVALSLTHRFQKKYVTLVLYKPFY